MNIRLSFALVALVFLGCGNLHAQVAEDEAVRAILGIRSARVEVPKPDKEKYYATTFAKFEKGKFTGYGRLGTGTNLPTADEDRRFIEVAWLQKEGKWGYVLVDPMSAGVFTEDPIFEHLSMTMRTKGLLPKHPQYGGFEVVGFAMSGNVRGSSTPLLMADDIVPVLQKYDYAIVLLYREFDNEQDYTKFIADFKKQ